MTPSQVRKKITHGETVYTAKGCYADPELVELIASAGFDAVWLCLEHKRVDPAVMYSLIQACRAGGSDALVRVKPVNHADLLWLLEAGVRGIMLPRVRHPDEVHDVLAAMKFPPLGRRGADLVHVDSAFGRSGVAEYVAAANHETFLVVQIEETEVVPHIETIAAMPGVDVLFVGPGDLSLGLGRKYADTADPEVAGIIRKVAEACKRHGKFAGIPCAPDRVAEFRGLGYRFFNVASDYRCVVNGLKSAIEVTRA